MQSEVPIFARMLGYRNPLHNRTRTRSSIQTTEQYLGSDQEIAVAVNDNLGL